MFGFLVYLQIINSVAQMIAAYKSCDAQIIVWISGDTHGCFFCIFSADLRIQFYSICIQYVFITLTAYAGSFLGFLIIPTPIPPACLQPPIPTPVFNTEKNRKDLVVFQVIGGLRNTQCFQIDGADFSFLRAHPVKMSKQENV
ncbi:hypothetical protein ILYODFUR_000870 [Ilyodon furcidens]|uniref:Uncharacterized protein n=1 Tax=Ilyodon furcidens TaxID=33524 RepID=A0ABV0ST87_9TELE